MTASVYIYGVHRTGQGEVLAMRHMGRLTCDKGPYAAHEEIALRLVDDLREGDVIASFRNRDGLMFASTVESITPARVIPATVKLNNA